MGWFVDQRAFAEILEALDPPADLRRDKVRQLIVHVGRRLDDVAPNRGVIASTYVLDAAPGAMLSGYWHEMRGSWWTEWQPKGIKDFGHCGKDYRFLRERFGFPKCIQGFVLDIRPDSFVRAVVQFGVMLGEDPDPDVALKDTPIGPMIGGAE